MRKLIVQYVKDLTAGRLAAGFEHCYQVYHLAREIGKSQDYDDEVLHAACFLHSIEIPARRLEETIEKAEMILAETGFPPDRIQLVIHAIRHHRPGSRPSSVEGMLLHDANLLDTMGATGVVRLSIGAFFWHHYKTMNDVLELIRERLSYSDSFHFDTARVLAEPKIRFMKLAVTQMAEELAQ